MGRTSRAARLCTPSPTFAAIKRSRSPLPHTQARLSRTISRFLLSLRPWLIHGCPYLEGTALCARRANRRTTSPARCHGGLSNRANSWRPTTGLDSFGPRPNAGSVAHRNDLFLRPSGAVKIEPSLDDDLARGPCMACIYIQSGTHPPSEVIWVTGIGRTTVKGTPPGFRALRGYSCRKLTGPVWYAAVSLAKPL